MKRPSPAPHPSPARRLFRGEPGASHEAHVRATGGTLRRGTFMEMRRETSAPYLQNDVGTADEEGPAT